MTFVVFRCLSVQVFKCLSELFYYFVRSFLLIERKAMDAAREELPDHGRAMFVVFMEIV